MTEGTGMKLEGIPDEIFGHASRSPSFWYIVLDER